VNPVRNVQAAFILAPAQTGSIPGVANRLVSMLNRKDDDGAVWPALHYANWTPTLTTLHMWTQIVGKVKLELTPFLNEWWNVGFGLTARGLTTSPIPGDHQMFQVDFDFLDHRLQINVSDGRRTSMPLVPLAVADFYKEFTANLQSLGIRVKINTHPVEADNHISFDEDHVHASYDPQAANRWWRISLQVSRLLERYRTPFVGKSSPVELWWGSFDVATTRFSGRPAPYRSGLPRWMALSGDQEYAYAGFWPGNEKFPEPAFVAYTYPEPPGYRNVEIYPEGAFFHPDLAEFVLPYDEVRLDHDPDQLVLRFFRSAYEAGATLARWDRAALERADPVVAHAA
jgi:hypothetical protein